MEVAANRPPGAGAQASPGVGPATSGSERHERWHDAALVAAIAAFAEGGSDWSRSGHAAGLLPGCKDQAVRRVVQTLAAVPQLLERALLLGPRMVMALSTLALSRAWARAHALLGLRAVVWAGFVGAAHGAWHRVTTQRCAPGVGEKSVSGGPTVSLAPPSPPKLGGINMSGCARRPICVSSPNQQSKTGSFQLSPAICVHGDRLACAAPAAKLPEQRMFAWPRRKPRSSLRGAM